jgi:hypothetical protein
MHVRDGKCGEEEFIMNLPKKTIELELKSIRN